jgi:GT2 family glycosyltransferase
MTGKTCVVIVTYGDRWHLLSQTLQAISPLTSVASIMVVDNGSTCDLARRIGDLRMERVTIVPLGQNMGSAVGFGHGLKAAIESDCDLIWVLDDDNIPEPSALEHLQAQYSLLVKRIPPESFALQAMRSDRQQYLGVARGESVRQWFPIENSYLGFHLAKVPAKLLRKMMGSRVAPGDDKPTTIPIPFGIYGGLFCHRSLLEKIGYPKEDFYLYGDDNEFTHRITREGGTLFLVPGSRITDAESSWAAGGNGSKISLAGSMARAPAARAYYSLRNGTWFFRHHYCRNRAVYGVNKWVQLGRLVGGLLLQGQFTRASLVLKAVRDGELGKLGKDPDHTL